MLLVKWDKKSRMQSIINREDIPNLKGDLLQYVFHEQRKSRLIAQLNITSKTKFSDMKETPAIVNHLNRFKVFRNATNITEIVQEK
eukprot:14931754-Ditylum_brightwellii.AAC.1